MKSNAISHFNRMSHNILYNITASRLHRQVVEKFAKKHGLIYFGSVNQHRDEHRVVRGFTASSTHNDNHYSVGSIDGIDIMIVDRSDAMLDVNNKVVTKNWLIMSLDFLTKIDLPHVFIGANNHETFAYQQLFLGYPNLKEINLGTFEQYDLEFTSRFKFYASPSDSIEAEKLFPAKTARVLGAHLWPYSVELHDGFLYIYCDDKKITPSSLETMLQISLWLVREIDSQIEQI